MNLINEFDNIDLSLKLLEEIKKRATKEVRIMEVCGTHTRSIYKYGIDKLLPSNIKMLSGPGCPVCVTSQSYIDSVIEISKKKNVIITTFGDMMRVPGSLSSLRDEKAKGSDIRVIYSPLDSLEIAKNNKENEVVFLAIGFETTAPVIALTLKMAKLEKIDNFTMLHSIKTMPNTMKTLVLNEVVNIDGFIAPGHVATIIGEEVFNKLAKESGTPMSICGFKSTGILAGILSIINMVNNSEVRCENLYKGFVKKEGNIIAKKLMNEVFVPSDSLWRGIGNLEGTGYIFKEEYEMFDAKLKFSLNIKEEIINNGCICGDILKGKKNPRECKLFGKHCNPNNPIGPCMVSQEGTCGIVYNASY